MDINRKTAYEVLFEIEKNSAYSNFALNDFIKKNKPENEAFVRELVYGVLENRLLLDYYLDALIPRGIGKLKKQDLTLLRMGLYQLRFMQSVPAYAAVNETVNMAKRLARGREGFINGVLRGYMKKADEIALPDRKTDLTAYLSVRYSAAAWIVKLWTDSYGEEKAEELLAAANRTPQMSIRVNTMKTSAEELMDMLRNEGFSAELSEKTPRALLVSGSRLLASDAYEQGLFSVQDIASIMVSDILDAQPGESVIDVCAAPGGKTMATAEKMQNCGKITAMDLYEHKLSLIENQAKRCGISIISTKQHDSTESCTELKSTADRVLADVPCSGLGVIGRKPEIKYKDSVDLSELTQRQARILEAAAEYVKKGGVLVYSTCTINRSENEKQIESFLSKHKDFRTERQIQLLPTEGTDGFFICRMVRG